MCLEGGAYQWYQNKLRWRGPRISLSDKFANACKRLCINFQVGTWHRFISWNFRCPTPKKKTDQSSASKNSSRCIFYQAMTPLKPFHPWSTVDISTINLHKSQSFHSHLRTLTIRHSLHYHQSPNLPGPRRATWSGNRAWSEESAAAPRCASATPSSWPDSWSTAGFLWIFWEGFKGKATGNHRGLPWKCRG